jgi:hypothetical protein
MLPPGVKDARPPSMRGQSPSPRGVTIDETQNEVRDLRHPTHTSHDGSLDDPRSPSVRSQRTPKRFWGRGSGSKSATPDKDRSASWSPARSDKDRSASWSPARTDSARGRSPSPARSDSARGRSPPSSAAHGGRSPPSPARSDTSAARDRSDPSPGRSPPSGSRRGRSPLPGTWDSPARRGRGKNDGGGSVDSSDDIWGNIDRYAEQTRSARRGTRR